MKTLIAVLAAVLLGLTAPARAGLLGGGLPSLPVQLPQRLTDPLRQDAQRLRDSVDALASPLDLHALGDALIERHPHELARDPAGQLIVRAELLALPSDDAARARVLALPGVALIEDQALDGLDLHWLRLRADTKLLAQLRALDPAGEYDYEHVYLPGGALAGAAATAPAAAAATSAAPAAGAAPALRVGLVDTGVAAHDALAQTDIRRAACADGARHPAAHGTAVASLLVGRQGRFAGVLPGAQLFAADAYCDAPDGGSVQRVAQGLAWLAREHVGVVNMSLVGPPNLLLQRAVSAAQARGMLIVAAVGNDGPAAPPLYPAAWPGVVGVTGVDAHERVLPEAGRGPQVAFAAPGSELWGASADGGYAALRGTSFAAPLVAGLLARAVADAGSNAAALERLRASAVDLGAPGRDDVYGWGLVGAALRTRRP
ncbi:MAG: S8 family serine peptidase [Pelomonas sp.]|nr:S8 family serine peptidase [Roseateles sp.]